MTINKPLIGRVVFSGLIASAISVMPILLERIGGYHPLMYQIFDALWVPGSILAMVVYPGGIHSGANVDNYVLTSCVLNFIIYFVVINILVLLISNMLAKRGLQLEK